MVGTRSMHQFMMWSMEKSSNGICLADSGGMFVNPGLVGALTVTCLVKGVWVLCSEDEIVRKTTSREVRILRTMRHENIVSLKEAFRRKHKLVIRRHAAELQEHLIIDYQRMRLH